ncbi:MAG TPA: DUF1707 domain-containing protein [Actinocrinis sp.]|uniref:DUF1707 SHOCT-like domain-containing protein n=1 Tax=Actinocrinis sp. TaxID=1920516 RepID=UPI002DDD1F64|nr:DUF1707 domain-containing protein [Actinocrinis sp.]HEV3173428.1 DUF1707 domain-containing protein [Actinocrinis sp.]
MTDAQDPNAALEMRASDADRERIAERLRVAAGHGRLTMDELEERLERAYGAKTYAELEPIIRDLPDTDAGASYAPGAASAAMSARVGGTASRKRWSIAVMSGATRRGTWVVPPRYNAFAFWGGVVLDLRQASYAQQETVIRANALMGGIEIIVPDDVHVHLEGVGIMGGYDEIPATRQPPPGAPVVRVTGIAFWAGVQVKRKSAPKTDKPRELPPS